VFDDVWETIDERYYDLQFHGVDWQKSRTTFRAAAAKAKQLKRFLRSHSEDDFLLFVMRIRVSKLLMKSLTGGIRASLPWASQFEKLRVGQPLCK
jgi:hypothetical protein